MTIRKLIHFLLIFDRSKVTYCFTLLLRPTVVYLSIITNPEYNLHQPLHIDIFKLPSGEISLQPDLISVQQHAVFYLVDICIFSVSGHQVACGCSAQVVVGLSQQTKILLNINIKSLSQ